MTRPESALPRRASGLLDLAHALAGSPGPATCAEVQEQLPDYLEAELNGQPARRRFPDLTRHLEACPACHQLYLTLAETALAATAAPLPVPAGLPALDLSFLPPLSWVERLRPLVEALTRRLLEQLDPNALADLAATSRAFFPRMNELGAGARLRPALAPALAFGAELPQPLQTLAAVYAATEEAVITLPPAELADELTGRRPPRRLRQIAQAAARDVGLSRREATHLAEQYVAQAQAHAAELLALAQRMADDERPG